MKRLCASIIATSLLLVISACHSSNNGVLAPNVVGYTVAAATAKLHVYGLGLGTQTTASNATVPTGEIISQSPSAGISVSNGSAVNVVVSSGPASASPGIARPSKRSGVAVTPRIFAFACDERTFPHEPATA